MEKSGQRTNNKLLELTKGEDGGAGVRESPGRVPAASHALPRRAGTPFRARARRHRRHGAQATRVLGEATIRTSPLHQRWRLRTLRVSGDREIPCGQVRRARRRAQPSGADGGGAGQGGAVDGRGGHQLQPLGIPRGVQPVRAAHARRAGEQGGGDGGHREDEPGSGGVREAAVEEQVLGRGRVHAGGPDAHPGDALRRGDLRRRAYLRGEGTRQGVVGGHHRPSGVEEDDDLRRVRQIELLPIIDKDVRVVWV